MRANEQLRDHAEARDGFVGAEDSFLPAGDYVDLITVFTFASREALEDWERDFKRKRLVEQLDSLCQRVSERATLDGLSVLAPDEVHVSKHETVLILIVLILVFGWIADTTMPPMSEPWRTLIAVTVNVCLVSYAFLPWSLRLWARFRKLLAH